MEKAPKNELAFIGANVYFRGNFKNKDEALKKFFEATESIGLEIDAEEYTEFRDDDGEATDYTNHTIEEIFSQRVDNTNNKTLLDREGQICNYGDMLYDKHGYEYRFKGIRYVQPHGLFQRLISVGKAGDKAVLTLIPNDKLNYYSDTIFVEPEWVSKWYSHKRFGKGFK